MKEQDDREVEIDGDGDAPDFGKLMDLMDEIERLGFDEKTAARFSRLIGNKPIVDQDGLVLVVERGKILAKLKLNLPPRK